MKPIDSQPPLYLRAADIIRGEILSGRMRSGDRLVETRLAADLGISRAPVREALKLLRAEGLVGEEPNRGAFVTSLSDADIIENL